MEQTSEHEVGPGLSKQSRTAQLFPEAQLMT